jgi:cytochrome bd ubiquinol oxidase subunit II
MYDVVAVILMLGICAYAVFGGADFGAGLWDLAAGGAQRGARPRAVLAHAIGPVWEANHVWLVFILVVLWTGFPEAFQSITLTLFVPLTFVAIGIVLRGASFAFRKEVDRVSDQREFGAAFAIASLIVPFFMGCMAGAIASGRVPAGGESGDIWSSWINPTSIMGGWLAVATCGYLAAVYLVWDARRLADDDMVDYFHVRAIWAAVIAGAVALAGVFVLRDDAGHVFDGLFSRALPLVILSVLCGLGSLVLLVRTNHAGARILATGAVAAIVLSWGIAQWPYILPTSLKVSDAAAPDPTLVTIVVVFVVAAIVIVPAYALLYTLDQKSLLAADETVSDRRSARGDVDTSQEGLA